MTGEGDRLLPVEELLRLRGGGSPLAEDGNTASSFSPPRRGVVETGESPKRGGGVWDLSDLLRISLWSSSTNRLRELALALLMATVSQQ